MTTQKMDASWFGFNHLNPTFDVDHINIVCKHSLEMLLELLEETNLNFEKRTKTLEFTPQIHSKVGAHMTSYMTVKPTFYHNQLCIFLICFSYFFEKAEN